jgi:uncharacterized protein YjbI with pentapeptide repeats
LDIKASDPSFQTLPDSKLVNLRATAQALVALIRKGARVKDMSAIYCFNCDLSGADVDLSFANLDRAILTDADFSKASLHGASFDGANLLGAEFVRSDLSAAKITDVTGNQSATNAIQNAAPEADAPDFSCADLSEADFSKEVLFGVYENNNAGESSYWSAKLNGANLKGANLSQVDIFVETELPQPMKPENELPPDLPFSGVSKMYNDPVEQEDAKAAPMYLILFSGSDLQIREPLFPKFNGLREVTKEISKALNWQDAKLPSSFRRFMLNHPGDASEKPDKTECKPRAENLAVP